MKEYSRAYYDRWYRNPNTRITSAEDTARKVHLAVSAAEYMLCRKVESVLDVGCGEASWFAPLRRLRPGVEYVGIESSPYIIEKFGNSRNVRLGTFGRLASLKLGLPFDLIVCADVVQYIPDEELRRGLTAIRRLCGGVAFIETFVVEDAMEGDHDGWHDRSERVMRRYFKEAGLTHCGLYCWFDERKISNVNRFEIG